MTGRYGVMLMRASSLLLKKAVLDAFTVLRPPSAYHIIDALIRVKLRVILNDPLVRLSHSPVPQLPPSWNLQWQTQHILPRSSQQLAV